MDKDAVKFLLDKIEEEMVITASNQRLFEALKKELEL